MIDIETMVEPPAAEPLKPIFTPVDKVAEFPHSDELPEGCQVFDINTDDFFYSTYITHETYVTRRDVDGNDLDLQMTIYTPFHDDGNMPDGKPEAGWPVIVIIRGAAFFKPNLSSFNSLYIRLAEKGYMVVVRNIVQAPSIRSLHKCRTAKPLYVMCAAMPNGWMLILIASHYSVTLLAAIPYLWQVLPVIASRILQITARPVLKCAVSSTGMVPPIL